MLLGKCNQCGLCCTGDDPQTRCGYLRIIAPLGTPGATECAKYHVRFNGMPIVMVRNGVPVQKARCAMGGPIEEMEIITKGIGRGCSLMLTNSDKTITIGRSG